VIRQSVGRTFRRAGRRPGHVPPEPDAVPKLTTGNNVLSGLRAQQPSARTVGGMRVMFPPVIGGRFNQTSDVGRSQRVFLAGGRATCPLIGIMPVIKVHIALRARHNA